ncbi:MAG TPA: hypothetical protein VF069_30305 [Streptosporangiaceae bacterium]
MRAVAAVAAAVAIQALMIVAFGWPSARLSARDVPLVVAGPPEAAATVAGRLAAERPGAFEIKRLPDERAARAALGDREAYGAIVVTPAGPRVMVASAASPAIAQQLGQLAERLSGRGPAAPVEDVVPADGDDPRGAAFGSMVLPLVMSGIAAGALLTFLVSGAAWRLAGLAGFAVAGGAAIAGIAQSWLSVLPGDYLAVAGVAGLGSLAVAGAVTGLGTALGRPGLGLAALTMLLLGNPLSGATSAPELLPQPWGSVGQALPPGATATLLRSVAFFDGAGAAAPLGVLLAWAGAGILLTAAGVFRARSRPAVADRRDSAALVS